MELLLSVTGDGWWGEIDTQVFENSWLDHSEEQQRQMREVIGLFSEADSRDELATENCSNR